MNQTLSLEITGMTCEHCGATVTKALRQLPGVENVEVTLKPGHALVHGSGMDPEQLVEAVRGVGFTAGLAAAGDSGTLSGAEGGADTMATASTLQGRRPATGTVPFTSQGGSFAADLVVIGGGSAGFAAAIRGHELGARVILINTGTIGGTCVNVGCVPSKTLIRAAEARQRASGHRFAGIEGSSRVTDFAAIIRQKDDLVASLRQAKYVDVLAAYDKVRLLEGGAVLRAADTVAVDGRELRAPRLVLATGSRPWLPPIPGLSEADPLTSTTAFELRHLPDSIIVLGGRYIALECAQMLARLGARVMILQRSDHLLPTEDDDLTEALAGYLREEGIQIETGARLRRVHREGASVVVQATVRGQDRIFEAARILCATGRRPSTDGMGLDEVGLRRGEDGRIIVNDHLQTSLPSVYAAGDVIGEPAYVYTAAYEGRLAVENALGQEHRKRDYSALPWVVFTDPQVAGVGLNERSAGKAGIAVEVARLNLTSVPRALAARDTRGFIKLMKERGGDRLVGARLLAPEGGEQIMEAALAIRHGIGVSDLAAAFHPYLTQAEAIKLCAQGFTKDVSKLSCCSA